MSSIRKSTLTLVFAAASATTAQTQSLSAPAVACKGERITRIDINANPPFRITGNAMWQRAARFAAKQHVTTRDAVIRRYLALQLGDACTEVRRAESERILRAQPFLADANVTAHSDGAGGIVLDVTTVDEVSIILGLGLRSRSPHFHSALLGEDNLLGSAIHLEGQWKKGSFLRDIYAGKFVDYQFLGRPYQLRLEGGRRELGGDWQTELSHPFLTDLQRLSWRTTAGSSDSYYYFRRPDAVPVALSLGRSYSDIGGVVRIGPPLGSLALVGASISFEDEDPGSVPVLIGTSDPVPDTSQALMNRYKKHQTARLNGLWGIRHVHFVRATGFDALEGTQDLRTGFQIATLVGKGVTFFRGKENDWFASTELYTGIASPFSYVALEVAGEGRRAGNADWDGVLAHGRGAVYLKPFNRHTIMTDLAWSGGWKQRIPFQLTFADRDGGMRGFRSSDAGGARRLVARAEDRYLIGRYKDLASLGVAGFMEAGKIWAGDSPFGITTPIHSSLGFSVLAASPPNSRRMVRADFAYPIKGRAKRGLEVRLVVRDFTRIFRQEPQDIFRNRERSVPSNVFSWP